MEETYSNSPVPARPTDNSIEAETSGEHEACYDPRDSFAFGDWFDPGAGGPDATHGDRTVRIAFIYDVLEGRGDDRSRGVATYCADGSDLARDRPPNASDPRWRCGHWHALAQEFLDSVSARFCDDGFFLAGDPAVSMTPPRKGGLLCYIATWALSEGGSVSALNHANIAHCGTCHGCRSTADAVTLAPVESWVYFVQATTGGPVKIGRSATPRARVASLQTANAAELRIVATMPGGATVERAMHATFAADRIRAGEWFNPSPALAALVKELGGVLK
jgi:hypothetical protein